MPATIQKGQKMKPDSDWPKLVTHNPDLIETVLNSSRAAIMFCDKDLQVIWFNGNSPPGVTGLPVGHNLLEFVDSVSEQTQILKDADVAAAVGHSEPRMYTFTPVGGHHEKILCQFYRVRDPETYEHIGFVMSGRNMTKWMEEAKKAKDTAGMIGLIMKDRINEAKYEIVAQVEMVCKAHCSCYHERGEGGCTGLSTVRKLIDNDGMLEKLSKLTPAERMVANYTKEGLSLKELARALNISVSTVQKHRTSIRKKLGLEDTTIQLHNYLQIL
jgi:DNA-binding CsgD family transcriptional regulator